VQSTVEEDAMRRYVIGVDVGTYSAKGVLVDADGALVAEHAVPYDLSMPQPGWAEHDADAVWWSALTTITRALLAHARVPAEAVAAVGTSAIGVTMLPLDEAGRPLRPSILYGIDTRAWREIEELDAALGRDAIFERAGKRLSTQSLGPKLLWFRKHEPEAFARTRSVVTANTYLTFRLTGELTVDRYTAPAFAPYFDLAADRWLDWADDLIAPHTLLPRVCGSAEVIGAVTPRAAQETGLAVGTPVIAGTTDAAAEALSVGVVDPGDTMLMYGTTLFVIQVHATWVKHPHLWSSTYVRPGRFSLAAGLATSAALTRWFRDAFGQPELAAQAAGGPDAYAALSELAATAPVGARGLVALPYFSGERTPIGDPKARGVLAGLTLSHSRADVYRALLEGVAYALRHNLDVMAEVGGGPRRLVGVGGGTKSAAWMQIFADVLGEPQEVPATTLGAAYGDAFMAALAAGLVSDWSDVHGWVRSERLIEPDPAAHQVYQDYYQVFRELYPATRALQHRLAALGAGPAPVR
jgi:xylulokinase